MNGVRLIRATPAFSMGGRTCPEGYPLLLGADGRIVPELTWYARKRYALENATYGSLMDEVYVLREWWDYLSESRIDFWNVSERTFLRWIRHHEQRMEKARVQRKIDVVHRFQRDVIREYKGGDFPLGIFECKKPNFTYPQSVLHSSAGRPTPDQDAVEAVLDCLADQPNHHLAARNWLIGKWMAETGLRRQGIAQLEIASLQHGLREEGLRTGSEKQFQNAGVSYQEAVFERLEDLRFCGRSCLFVEVLEKRSKKRMIEVPVDLFIETLEFVWSERSKVPGGTDCSSLWISQKTGGSLTSQAIGDIVKKAFRSAGVRGSGHRLRAFFACRLVYRLYSEAHARDGKAWDATSVLLRAAELMGHSRIETLRPYLNRAIREDAFGGRSLHWN